MSKRNDDKKNIVIVGGGYGGHNIARPLSGKLDPSKYNLILVTKHPYYVHLMASARLTVSGQNHRLDQTALMEYDKMFINGNGTLKIGTVVAIEEDAPGKGGNVVIRGGEKVRYDALVLATGSTWKGAANFPETDAEIRQFIAGWREKYARAKHVVIVGGGAVGIETAGEIRDAYPDKKITIVQSGRLLLNDTYPDSFRRDLERRLRSKGVEIVLDDAVEDVPEGVVDGVKTRNGKMLSDADLVVYGSGSRPNTDFIASLDPTILTDTGDVKVNPTLEVVGHPGVFAAGDIIAWKQQKQADKAKRHGPIVVANVLSYVSGTPPKTLYKGSYELVMITVGKYDGAAWLGILWGISLGGFLTSLLKGRDLVVSIARSQLGL